MNTVIFRTLREAIRARGTPERCARIDSRIVGALELMPREFGKHDVWQQLQATAKAKRDPMDLGLDAVARALDALALDELLVRRAGLHRRADCIALPPSSPLPVGVEEGRPADPPPPSPAPAPAEPLQVRADRAEPGASAAPGVAASDEVASGAGLDESGVVAGLVEASAEPPAPSGPESTHLVAGPDGVRLTRTEAAITRTEAAILVALAGAERLTSEVQAVVGGAGTATNTRLHRLRGRGLVEVAGRDNGLRGPLRWRLTAAGSEIVNGSSPTDAPEGAAGGLDEGNLSVAGEAAPPPAPISLPTSSPEEPSPVLPGEGVGTGDDGGPGQDRFHVVVDDQRPTSDRPAGDQPRTHGVDHGQIEPTATADDGRRAVSGAGSPRPVGSAAGPHDQRGAAGGVGDRVAPAGDPDIGTRRVDYAMIDDHTAADGETYLVDGPIEITVRWVAHLDLEVPRGLPVSELHKRIDAAVAAAVAIGPQLPLTQTPDDLGLGEMAQVVEVYGDPIRQISSALYRPDPVPDEAWIVGDILDDEGRPYRWATNRHIAVREDWVRRLAAHPDFILPWVSVPWQDNLAHFFPQAGTGASAPIAEVYASVGEGAPAEVVPWGAGAAVRFLDESGRPAAVVMSLTTDGGQITGDLWPARWVVGGRLQTCPCHADRWSDSWNDHWSTVPMVPDGACGFEAVLIATWATRAEPSFYMAAPYGLRGERVWRLEAPSAEHHQILRSGERHLATFRRIGGTP